MSRLLLASASPRRAELLARAGVDFDRGPAPDADETPPPGASPAEAALAIAERKARKAAAAFPERTVLAADTVVWVGSRLLGKPRDAADAERMLRALSGVRHGVATGVAVAHGDRLLSAVETAEVVFRRLSDDEIRAYVATGEPMDKAGAYALQGGAARFVEALRGSPDTVVGLPVARARALWEAFGVGAPASPSR